MEVLFSCLLAITLGILIIVSLLQCKQQSKSLQKDIENRSPFSFCHLLQDVVSLLSGDVNSLSSSHSQPLSHLCILPLSHSWGSSSYQILSVICCCHSSCFKDFFCTHYITTIASGQKDQFCYQKIANDSGPRSLKHLTKAGEDETNQKYCKYSPLPEKGFHKI